MENLIGNFWLHDDGSGAVSLYQRIGRNLRPLRYETEPSLLEQLPFEAQQVIRERLNAAAIDLNARTPKEVRLARLREALALFPAFTSLREEDQADYLESMCEGIPDTFVSPEPETQGLPRLLTVEEQVKAANEKKAQEIDAISVERTKNMHLEARIAELEAAQNEARIAELEAAQKATDNGQAT